MANLDAAATLASHPDRRCQPDEPGSLTRKKVNSPTDSEHDLLVRLA